MLGTTIGVIDMEIPVSQLLGRNGASQGISFAEDWKEITGYPDVVVFLEPVKIEGILTNEGGILLLDAEGHTMVELSCSRCLSPVSVKIDFKLKEKFTNAGIFNEEAETFSGDYINLTDVIRRTMIAAMPIKVLCKEDCRGLCSKCGQDLNQKECGCDTTYFDPRFEGLRALFKVDEEV